MPTLPLTDIEKRAWEYAKLKHHGVFRKFQGASYFEGHVAKVFGLLKQVDTDPTLGCAALLHDTIEDTDATWEDIKEIFGKRVANFVQELTSDEEKINLKGKKDYLLDKMVEMSDGALLIKLCDRLQNISDSYNASERFRDNYYKETRYIIDSLKKERRLNRKQMRIVQQIEGLLGNIKTRYKYEKMTYIKKFNEADQFTILDDKVKDMLPETISVYSTNGSYKLKKDVITRETDILRASYSHNTMKDYDGADSYDGEPDNLEFDMHFMGSGNSLKIAVDISYGDSMMSEFTITTPNKVKVGHYTGINSDADPDTHFGFEDNTLKDLCKFFNQFGFKLTPQDFNFIDKYPDTYVKEDVKLTPLSHGQIVLVVNNDKATDGKYLKDLVQLLKTRGVEYQIATTAQDVKRISEHNKVMGCILSGSEYSLVNPGSEQEGSASREALKLLECPILGLCYGAQLMAKESGGQIKPTGKRNLTHIKLSEYEPNHPLFKSVDMKNIDFSFDFHDMIKSCPGYKTIGKVGSYIVAFSDDTKKRFGLLFHPEDTERTWKVIDNFIAMFHNNQIEQDALKQGKFQHVQNFESFRKI